MPAASPELLGWLALGLGVILLLLIASLAHRVSRAERRLAQVMERLGMQEPGAVPRDPFAVGPPPVAPVPAAPAGIPSTTAAAPRLDEGEILALVRDRKKIEAIKIYRARTGIGLREAKDAVEAIARSHGV
jgi:hypothetical protein